MSDGRDAHTDRVMFWNLHEAGIDRLHGDNRRWHLQRDLISALRPRVLMITEGWAWHFGEEAYFKDAKAALGMHGALFAAKTGCNMAIFWEPCAEVIAVEPSRPDLAAWHGHGSATLHLPGWSHPLRFAVAHLDPFSPVSRLIESDRLRQFAAPDTPTVLAMDANTVPPGDPEPDWTAVPPHRRADHLMPGDQHADRAPLQRLLGVPDDPLFVDAGAHTGDRRPTYGLHPPGGAARRTDVFLLSPSLAGALESYHPVHDVRLAPSGGTPAASDHLPIALRLRRR
ncbi:endonuclease/exonuclease/phosphatase family protein [Sorangium sp. So ce1151]|uniref:endonuclease/exonuclease/phosphatase family protein n=1 Tax=Sorangium sp. So ce1151 TaxID=3133332 RepID=UPI003F5E9D26